MAGKGPGLGEELADRLMSRSGEGISRRTIGAGIEVFSGQLVDRAMGAMGGRMRGFTMDRAIFMPSSFDSGNPEHQATAVHEWYHQRNSGGDDGGGGRHGGNPDQEERRARTVEDMVYHRAAEGEDLDHIVGDIVAGGDSGIDSQASGGDASGSGASSVSNAVIGGDRDRDPMEGYRTLVAEGYTHKQVVDELKQFVIDTLVRLQEEQNFRTSESDFM